MELPYLQSVPQIRRQQIVRFGGLNLGEGPQDGELSDCLGVSARKFPALCQRRERRDHGAQAGVTALYAQDKLCMVSGTGFFYDGVRKGTVTAGRKSMASIGTSVVIFPDKVCYNTETDTFGSLTAAVSGAAGKAVFTDKTLAIAGVTMPFQVGDAVEITGCVSLPENNKTPIIKEVSGSTLTFAANTFTEGTETAAVTLSRNVPDLTCVCQSSNRLWGCEGDTIYGSKLGDPFNFFCYEGLSTDSYAVPVGTPGDFTACYPFGTTVLFFKEDVIHKLYGSKPANYSLVTSQVPGVAAGCAGTLCAINETLYYLGRVGVYAYNGGVPDLVSEKIGRGGWSDGLAATDGECYYLSAKRENTARCYVYDPGKSTWHVEADRGADALTAWGGVVWFAMGGRLWASGAEGGAAEGPVAWSATLCPFRETVENRKCFSRLTARVVLEDGAWIKAEVSCDGAPFRQVFLSDRTRQGTILIPIRPQRCDSFTVRLSGRGGFTLLSLTREFQIGSVR